MTYSPSPHDTFTYDNTEWRIVSVWLTNDDGSTLVTGTPLHSDTPMFRNFTITTDGARLSGND